MDKKHWNIKKYSTSVLKVYLLAIAILSIMAIFDNNIEIGKITIAIGICGVLIVAGDLFCSPFVISSQLRRTYSDLATVCKHHCLTTDISNQFIDGECAKDWLVNKESEATIMKNMCAVNERAEEILFYFGNILITLGFSFFLLVFASERVYNLIFSKQPFLTIFSFILLMLSMIIKEKGEYSVDEVSQNKENVMKITRLLRQKHQKYEDKGKE